MADVAVDFNQIIGKIKPVHGVNNGPLERNFVYDLRTYFKQARIPFSRLHDTEGAYSAGHFVDVPAIFKNFEADETLPENYDFECTDAYLKGIKDCGTDIIYRLGVTIENMAEQEWGIPMHIHPPKDYLKWARICEHIIRHYNEGWADGYHMEIQYWEIWNEPESAAMWTGTFEEFTNFYITASRYLKGQFPKLKFGGYGSIGFYSLTRHDDCFAEEPYISLITKIRYFLTEAKKSGAPVDFFSWHLYSANVEEYGIYAKEARRILDECGFPKAESILDEWNTEELRFIQKMRGTSLAAAVLCTLQKSPVDIANYYDARIPTIYNGLFEQMGNGKVRLCKSYYAMRAFGELYALGDCVYTECEEGLYACAARNGDAGMVLVANYSDSDTDVMIRVNSVSDHVSEATIYLLCEELDMEPVKREYPEEKQFVLYQKLPAYSVAAVKIKDWKIDM